MSDQEDFIEGTENLPEKTPEKEKARIGRKPIWTPEQREIAIKKILGRIATSRDSIPTICDEDESLPAAKTFYEWLGEEPEGGELGNRYARAKEAQADVLLEEMVDIADTPMPGTKTKVGPLGTEVTQYDMIEHRKLQIDTRKWVLGKLRPKKYGDFSRNEITGPGGGAIQITVTENQAGIG